jgi:NAD dependent epimerase/dehydratase family enzyme
MKTIVIAGASGFVGSSLRAFFMEQGWKVLTIGRSKADGTWNNQPSLVRAIDGADAVVNLAGKSVNCRFTEENVKELVRRCYCALQTPPSSMDKCRWCLDLP